MLRFLKPHFNAENSTDQTRGAGYDFLFVYVWGRVSRPIFDRLKLSREKLAYLLDATAAAIATLIPINSWGAYILGLLESQNVESPLRALALSIPFHFYPILTVGLALGVVLTGQISEPCGRPSAASARRASGVPSKSTYH